MRHLLIIFAALLFCAPVQAQTMKALMYNTTNGQVAYSGTNGLRFVESVAFSSDVFGFSFEAASGSNYTQLTPDGVDFSGDAQRTTTRANLGFSTNLNTLWTATNASNARSAVGIPLPALTNTSNVTMMRALAGSTNTNQPFSGIIQYADSPTGDIYEMTVSNGIILKTEMQ